MLPENWNHLKPDDKFDARLDGWASREGKEFATDDAATAYERRGRRLADAIRLREPDRVPVLLTAGGFVAEHAGVDHAAMMYDYPKAVEALIKYHRDFDVDYQAPSNFMPGPIYDRLGYKLYKWPGNQLSPNQPFQAVEGEYMSVDEYDQLIADPERFITRTYTPRVLDALGGLEGMPSFWGTTELPFVPFMMAPFAAPPIQEAFEAIFDSAKLALEYLGALGQAGATIVGEMGLPGTLGGFTKVPYDFIGDTLRGTRGIMLDMYREPEKLLAACEALVPMAVEMAVGAATAAGNPFVFVVMHKGADGFMSNEDFAKFYWPGFKAIMLGMIEEGVIPFNFVEGGYNSRLDIIAEDNDIPAGRTAWMFDKTDMAEAKKKFGSWACVGGNVPASLFKAGTPERMDSHVKGLLDVAAPGGGFFLAPGAVVDNATDANVEAYLRAGKEYGTY